MLTDLINNKWSREIYAVWMENIVSGMNQECFKSCFHSVSQCLAKVPDTAMTLLHCPPSPQCTLLAGATTPCRLVIPLLRGQGESAGPFPGLPCCRRVTWVALRGASAIPQGWQMRYIASLHSRPSVHGEEPYPTRGDPVLSRTQRI